MPDPIPALIAAEAMCATTCWFDKDGSIVATEEREIEQGAIPRLVDDVPEGATYGEITPSRREADA